MADSPETPNANGGSHPSVAIAEEAVLNAAMAFAGQVATAAQQNATQAGEQATPVIRDVMVRQYLLETATLCLRRLAESYEAAAADPSLAEVADLLQDATTRAREATAAVEALGDLSLDVLDQLLES